MAKMQFGTDTISGLNVGTVADKIQPHELQLSESGWTDQEGAWTVAKAAESLYTGYTGISAFAAGRMGGADHLVWIDSNKLYDNGVEIGAITEGASMKIIALDDKFLILGASVNYIYDGDHIREHGTWQPERMAMRLVRWTPTDQGTITAITQANPGVVTMTDHELETGDYVYLSGGDMVELAGRQFLVTRIDANSFSINENTTNHTAYTSGCTYNRRAGLDGVYKWYMTCTLELSDGTVLESRPRGLAYNSTDDSRESWEAEAIVMTSTDGMNLDKGTDYSMVWWNYASADLFDISGTRGTDYFPGMRIYRTKADGEDFYLEREWRHGDSNFTYLAGGSSAVYYPDHDGTSAYNAVLGAPDRDLGAVYTASATDHGLPPVSSLAVTVGQVLFLNDTSNPKQYWWSHLDGIEYFNPLGWNLVPDAVTSLSQLDEKLVVTSQDRLFVDYFTGGAPDFHEIRTDTGSVTGITATTDDGVLFLEEDGLWLFDGARVTKISRRGFDTLTTPKSISATKDTVYMGGSLDSYVVRNRDGGMSWHEGDSAYQLSSATGGKIYGATTSTISQLFNATESGGTMTTAAFNAGKEVQVDRVILDIEGATVPTVWVNGNRQSDSTAHTATSTADAGTRRRVWVPIPLLSNHVFSVKIVSTGALTVYGVWLEVVG